MVCVCVRTSQHYIWRSWNLRTSLLLISNSKSRRTCLVTMFSTSPLWRFSLTLSIIVFTFPQKHNLRHREGFATAMIPQNTHTWHNKSINNEGISQSIPMTSPVSLPQPIRDERKRGDAIRLIGCAQASPPLVLPRPRASRLQLGPKSIVGGAMAQSLGTSK